MKALIECLIQWLEQERVAGKPWQILHALARETLKRADSPDEEQRHFDALDISAACEPEKDRDYESAKKWLTNSEFKAFINSRRTSLENFFRKAGHTQALELTQIPSKGKNRTVWFFKPYDIELENRDAEYTETPESPDQESSDTFNITYQVTEPGEVKINWFGRLILGNGSFKTRSWRGVLWGGLFLSTLFLILAFLYFLAGMRNINRPVQTNDLIFILILASFAWLIWRLILRSMVWLVEDRIVMASDVLLAFTEDAAQLDMKKIDEFRHIRLVRYSAVCPICAGSIELRYGHGENHRRIFGCCSESPAEHVYTFDRVTQIGHRYQR